MQLKASTSKLLTLTACVILMAQLAQAQSIWTATNGVAADTNWTSAVNWSPNGVPGPGTNVVFADAATNAAGVINNVVDMDTTILSLMYGSTIRGYHTTLIPTNITLTITGAVPAIGTALFVGNGQAIDVPVNAAILGDGALVITNSTGYINIRQGNDPDNNSHFATLDMSGLSSFTAYVSNILVAADGAQSGKPPQQRERGKLYFAKTNYIVCSASGPGLLICAGLAGTSATAMGYLGQANTFYSDGGMTIGGAKSAASTILTFAPGVVNGSVVFRNRAGTDRQSTWNIGNNSVSSSTAANGTVDFSSGTVDAMVGTIMLGYTLAANVNGVGNGTLTVANGTINVNTLELGYETLAAGAPARGILNLGAGQLTVNNNLRLGYTAGAGSSGTLTANGGSVWVKGNIIDGGGTNQVVAITNGTLKVGGTVGSSSKPLQTMIINNTALTFDLGSAANPTSPLWQVTSLTDVGPIPITVLGSGLTLGQFALIKYGGSLQGDGWSGFTSLSLPSRLGGYLSNNTANSSIDLVITSAASPKWQGNVTGGAWDINTTANWVPTSGGAPITYLQFSVPGDSVLFDDSATGTTTVDLTTILSPGGITLNNSSKDYTFSGSGGLSGSTALTKNGSRALTIANTGTNDFVGGVLISAGKVQIAGSADRLPTNATVSLGDNSTAVLDLNGINQTIGSLSGGGSSGGNVTLGAGTLNIAAGGGYSGVIAGDGMVVKSGSGTQTFYGANMYAGGTLVTGGTLVVANTGGSGTGFGTVTVATNATFQIGDSGANGSITTGTITNNGSVALNRSDDFTWSEYITGTGGLIKNNTDRVTISTPNNYSGPTSINAGVLQISNAGALGTTGLVTIAANATAQLELIGGITLQKPINMTQKSATAGEVPAIINVSGTNTLAGPISLVQGGSRWTFRCDSDKLVVAGPITCTMTGGGDSIWLLGSGIGEIVGNIQVAATETNSLVKGDSGTWTLWGTNTYLGNTRIDAGTLIVNGPILGSVSITVGTDNMYNPSATLTGTGLMDGPVLITGFSSLCGNSVTAAGAASGAPAGVLTISNSLTLKSGSLTVMGVSPSGCDQVVGLSNVSLSGTLQVVVTSGRLVGGEAFKLFASTTYSGTGFENYNLPDLGAPELSWNTSTLQTDGTLRVAGSVVPQVLSVTSTGLGNFQFSGWGPTNWTYQILATTNVTEARSNWVQVSSGTFTGGTFTFSDPQAGLYPRRFYQVVTQWP